MAKEANPLFTTWKTRVESCKDRRVMWEAQVATCMHFESGNHQVWWDKQGKMREKKIKDNEVWRPINLIPSALAVITSRMIANDPRWHPKASELEDVTEEELDAADAALQDIWEGDEYGDYSVKQEMKLVLRHGWLQGGRLVYFRFDEEVDMPVMDSFSLWDTFSDSPQKLREKQWLTIPCPKGVGWVKNNPSFDATKRLEIDSDHKLAESGLHQQFLRRQTGNEKNIESVLLYYNFEVKLRDARPSTTEKEDDRQEGESEGEYADRVTQSKELKKAGKERYIEFSICTYRGLLTETQELDYPKLSALFDVFHPVENGDFYARPIVDDWIEPSKSIDKTNSNVEAYMDTFLHGKWLLRHRGVSRPLAGREGQVLIDETGNSVTQLPMVPLPQTHFQYKNDAERHFERLSGVHGASLGSAPANIESGVGLSQVLAMDEQNTSDPVDNYRMFLKRCAKKLLRQMADNWSDVRTVYRFDRESGEQKPMKIVGESFYNKEDAAQEGAVRLRPFKRLDVDIEMGILWKESQRRKEWIDLMGTGWTPGMNPVMDSAVLDIFNMGSFRPIVRQLREMQNPHSYLAEGKSRLIMAGESVPIEQNDPHEFYWNFYKARAEERLKAGDQRGAALLNAQAQQHAILMEETGNNAGSPELPETLDELTNVQGETVQ